MKKRINKDKNKIINIATNMLIFITLVLVMVVHKFNSNDEFLYLSGAFSILYIVVSLFFLIKNHKKTNLLNIDKVVITIFGIYIAYIVIHFLKINRDYLPFVISKCITLITFIFMIINMRINKSSKEARIFLSKIYIILIIFFCVCALIGINFQYSSKTIIHITRANPDFHMWFTHKCRLSSFIVFSIGLIITYNFKNIFYKIGVLLMGFIVVFKSDDITALAVYIISVLIMILILNKDKIKGILKPSTYIIGIGAFASIGAILLYYVKKKKNISNLGDRTNIWKVIMPYIKKFPQGLGNTDKYSFVARRDLTVHSAHNIFLQEFLESGHIAGILLIVMMISIIVYLYKYNKIYLISFIGVILLANMDVTITIEFYNIFFCVLAVIYADAKKWDDVNESDVSNMEKI
jgi:hypothetical protein